MNPNISSQRLPTTAAAVGVISLLFVFNAGNAFGGNALGGALGGVGGALGGLGGAVGGVIGGGGGAPAGGTDAAANGNGNGVGAQVVQGMAVGKIKRKLVVPVGEGKRCDNTFLNFLRRHNCDYRRITPDEADGNTVDQASYSPVEEPLVRKPKRTKNAEKLQPPVRKKTTAPKSIARLNIEKPSVEKPKLTVDPKLNKPNAKSEPRLSCDKAGGIVGGYGFSAIKSSDCDGPVYAFNASRDGKSFTVTLNAVSGELIDVRKVP